MDWTAVRATITQLSMVATCNMTVVKVEGGFGSWGKNYIQEKFRKCNVTRAGATVLEDEDSYVTKWQRGIHLLTNLDRVCRVA